jgi:hypothetical protein
VVGISKHAYFWGMLPRKIEDAQAAFKVFKLKKHQGSKDNNIILIK